MIIINVTVFHYQECLPWQFCSFCVITTLLFCKCRWNHCDAADPVCHLFLLIICFLMRNIFFQNFFNCSPNKPSFMLGPLWLTFLQITLALPSRLDFACSATAGVKPAAEHLLGFSQLLTLRGHKTPWDAPASPAYQDYEGTPDFTECVWISHCSSVQRNL